MTFKSAAPRLAGGVGVTLSLLASLILSVGCKSEAPPEPAPAEPAATATTKLKARPASSTMMPVRRSGGARPRTAARPVASVPVSEDDPLKGEFSLAQATKDLKGQGALLADLDVEISNKGRNKTNVKLTCALFEDKAPITVANFVGLARGLRPWKSPNNKWVTKPAYDGTLFHRIIKGFMIQGGDSTAFGVGEPGYVIPDEIWEGGDHDRAGLLCMANRGKNTNGAQFFITDAPAPHLDNGYTIFGECASIDDIHKIASVEVHGERPTTPPKIKRISVRRGQSPVTLSAAASASATEPAAAPPAASQ